VGKKDLKISVNLRLRKSLRIWAKENHINLSQLLESSLLNVKRKFDDEKIRKK
jgi:hypothetical protein